MSCVEVLHIRLQWQMSRHRCEEEGNSTTLYPKKLYGYNVVDLLIKPVALICLIWNLVTSPPGRPSRQRDYHPSTSKRKHQSVIGRLTIALIVPNQCIVVVERTLYCICYGRKELTRSQHVVTRKPVKYKKIINSPLFTLGSI